MNITIGTGKAVHTAYTAKDGSLYGSMCDPYVYCKGSRMNKTDAPATCARCAKATNRAAQQAARDNA
jgi:hypothetical protein